MSRTWIRAYLTPVFAVLFGLGLGSVDAAAQTEQTDTVVPSTADHSQFEVLQQSFASGPELTKACLSCHNQAARQIHATKHWNWQFFNVRTGQLLGMKNVVNNSFISVSSNLPFCTRCHIGFEWTDERFDFSAEEQVDCLACHDTTGTYGLKRMHLRKAKCSGCHVAYDRKKVRDVMRKPDFSALAMSVGKTSRASCGTCHFRGDGGDGVKHGDLDSSLIEATREVDVHMAADGLNFTCTTCHETDQHRVPGSRYVPVSKDVRGMDVVGGSRATCESCHGLEPHPEDANSKINDHVDRIACQTCHIPEFARGGVATKTYWDWSTAGRFDDKGKQIVERDDQGRIVYSTKRGDGRWAENVVPDYVWFNGEIEQVTLGDKIDPGKLVHLLDLGGAADDSRSRIWPVKTLLGKQPYDVGNSTLAAVHLFGKDDDAYWTGFEWEKSVAAGMKAAGQNFSGKYDFAETETHIPINHMVAPAKNALPCESCHDENGRMAMVSGVYIPGRDANPLLDFFGIAMILGTLAGVCGHGVVRMLMKFRNGRKS